MRILLGLCVVLLLGGCNRVYTPGPLFTEADGAATPALRDGVWLVDGQTYLLNELGRGGRCRVDTSKPVTRWKKCATWLLIRDGQILQLSGKGKQVGWTVATYRAVGGEPQILQFDDHPEVYGAPEEPADDQPPTPPRFAYFGLAPGQIDADGKATAFESWPVLCGPYPPETKKGEETRFLTLELHPGLVEDGNNCTTTSKDAVRAAAAASRAWYGEPMRARWIRDTYP